MQIHNITTTYLRTVERVYIYILSGRNQRRRQEVDVLWKSTGLYAIHGLFLER